MRLSGLVVATILLVSVTVLAQHSSGGGSSSGGGGGSHGGSSSGGFSSSASSHVSSANSFGSSHSTGTASSANRGKVASGGVRGASDNVRPSSVKPEKKGLFSFWRHKQPEPKSSVVAFTPPSRCKKGQVCTCVGGGSLNTAGQCGFQPQVFACPAGRGWNGYGCGAQYWSNDCRSLAEQLRAQRAQMQGQNDYGQGLRYRLLQQQYQQCLMRSRFAFGAYASNAFLFDAP